MRIRSITVGVATALLALLSSSCGPPSRPSESEGRAVLEQLNKDNTRYRLVAFRKTNGQSTGSQQYWMSYDATYEVIAAGGYCACGSCMLCPETRIPYGGTYTRSGIIDFTKSENGWQGSSRPQ